MARIIIDPVTRIEGHLRIDVEVENGVVTDCWSSGTMFRGYEMLLKGKHPWDAQQVTERICGVCPMVHGTASSYCLDDALGVDLPDNARIIRNLMLGSNYIQSHILHFYHLAALDYIDITAVGKYTGSDPALTALKDKVVGLVQAGDVYPFLPRYESPDYVADPTIVTTLVSHYVQALEMRKKAQEMIAVFYGRMPSFVGTIPGGVTQKPTIDRIAAVESRLAELRNWIDNVYVQDVLLVAETYKAIANGIGFATGNFLSYGVFDQDSNGKEKFLPSGVIMGGAASDFDETKITESVKHSWYKDETEGLHPSRGKTDPEVTDHEEDGKYSFLKAPRYDGKSMEVGPLARMLVKKPQLFLDVVNKYGITQPGLVARHGARAIECKLVADEMAKWLAQLQPGRPIWDKKDIPDEGQGRGLVEGPRGALGHWISIKAGKIDNYQAVVPTTWNASPRDKDGQRGAIEQSMIGIPVPDVDNPINVVRNVRSYDPCIACAVHVIHPEHNGVKAFRVI
ncbi:MAG: nickel-dependent hydrogenase large subunit [Candidatus Geothermincolia bacterium]